jgi:hypothetical protein
MAGMSTRLNDLEAQIAALEAELGDASGTLPHRPQPITPPLSLLLDSPGAATAVAAAADPEEEEELPPIPSLPRHCLPQASGRTNAKALQGLARVQGKRARRQDPGEAAGEQQQAAEARRDKRRKRKKRDASPTPPAAPVRQDPGQVSGVGLAEAAPL